MKRKIWKWLKRLFLALLLLLVSIWSIDKYVANSANGKVYNAISELPYNKVGLLLGTSKYAVNGGINYFYKYRIEAAVSLFKNGKIDFILVSGDNGTKGYNEPELILEDLVAAGIPPERIFLDYAGFRTLDSVVRSNAIFGCTSITVISQQFHNERALFIAQQKGINAIAYNAKDVYSSAGTKVLLREKLARVNMVLDLLFNKQPKFYGPKIEIK